MKIKYFTCPKCGHADWVEIDGDTTEIVCTSCGNKPDHEHLEQYLDDLETF